MRLNSFLLVLLVSSASVASAANLKVRVKDGSGAPLPDQLIIVRSLDEPKEVFRVLSDKEGNTPEHDLVPGLYRLISTNPYGAWGTVIREFVIGFSPVSLDVQVPVEPTHGFGDRVPVHTLDYVPIHVRVWVVDDEGKPIPKALVLVRSFDLDFEHWYKTSDRGDVKIELPDPPITILGYWQGKLAVTELNDSQAASSSGKAITLKLK
ncbi:MAG TPA: hypothetical protein VME23_18440 [Terracidiphilus sp.]|nr:hypothetical protein [Terracidiphilus sp.]